MTLPPTLAWRPRSQSNKPNGRQDDVHERPGERDVERLLARLAKSRDVHRHRPGVAEGREVKRDQQRRHENRAEGVDVPHGIERQTFRVLGRGVAEEVGHPTVADFVKDDRRQSAM